jgi:hypothetical protein
LPVGHPKAELGLTVFRVIQVVGSEKEGVGGWVVDKRHFADFEVEAGGPAGPLGLPKLFAGFCPFGFSGSLQVLPQLEKLLFFQPQAGTGSPGLNEDTESTLTRFANGLGLDVGHSA